jgi:hypothetical protein
MRTYNDFRCNYEALYGNDTYCYFDGAMLGGRYVETYFLQDEGNISEAVSVIKKLLKDNPELCPTFSMDSLKQQVAKKPYLIIHGRAVSLLKSPEQEKEAECRDEYFTGRKLKHPILCSQGHVLERKLAEFWHKKYPDSCPAGDDHGIESLQEDKKLERDLRSRLLRRSVIQKVGSARKCGTIGKLCFKIAGKKTCALVCKKLLKGPAKKAVAASFAKKIPFLGAGVGMVLGVCRALKGEYGRAVEEVASGVLACLPGPGTALSYVIDGALFTDDVFEAIE